MSCVASRPFSVKSCCILVSCLAAAFLHLRTQYLASCSWLAGPLKCLQLCMHAAVYYPSTYQERAFLFILFFDFALWRGGGFGSLVRSIYAPGRQFFGFEHPRFRGHTSSIPHTPISPDRIPLPRVTLQGSLRPFHSSNLRPITVTFSLHAALRHLIIIVIPPPIGASFFSVACQNTIRGQQHLIRSPLRPFDLDILDNLEYLLRTTNRPTAPDHPVTTGELPNAK